MQMVTEQSILKCKLIVCVCVCVRARARVSGPLPIRRADSLNSKQPIGQSNFF